MCGGRGTRLGSHLEKPLVPVGGRACVDWVLDALATPAVDRVIAATTPATPATAAHLSIPTVETPGEGYVTDLEAALATDLEAALATDLEAALETDREAAPGSGFDTAPPSLPVLTVAADLPLLSADVVERICGAHDEGSVTVAVPVERKQGLGVTVDARLPEDQAASGTGDGRELAPSGCNVVGDGGAATIVMEDDGLAVNVNRPRDLAVARRRIRERE